MTDLEKLAERVERATGRGCTCMEIYGEDPACPLHGRGTPWRQANPDMEGDDE